jgi:hypothetical protein
MGYIELSDPLVFETPSSFSARDEFNQSAGALTGKTDPVGGVWAGAGDADDFTVETTGKTAQRTTVVDFVNAGRYAVSGVAAFAAQCVQADVKWSATLDNTTMVLGVLARYVDTDNWMCLELRPHQAFQKKAQLRVRLKVAGVVTTPVTVNDVAGLGGVSIWHSLRLLVDAAGRWFVWAWQTGAQPGSFLFAGQHSSLATGGALASGKPGIYDENSEASTAQTRNYDNFLAFVTTANAAVFAGRSLELRHNTAVREEETAGEWSTVPVRDGKYLRLAPAGMEGRVNRIAVAAYRNDPDTMGNDDDDALTATLYGTPVYLSVPEP